MILTTTDIKRNYKFVDVMISSGDAGYEALNNLKKDVKRCYPRASAIIGIRMFYSPLVDGEQYKAYGTVVKFSKR